MTYISPNLQPYSVTVDEWHEHHTKLESTYDGVFGGYDPIKRERSQGLIERLERQGLILKCMAALLGVITLHDLGLPTQVIGPWALKFLGISVGG